ncbi:MAG: Asp23/Gls24 family envelope stress response protein [Clostridia bacterium]|nr:Asp23/Gls24 family envelope stress response protein [Clostridia bacterium]
MLSKTTNAYGKITITEKSIAHVVYNCTKECYGVVDVGSTGFFETIRELFCKSYRKHKGVKVKAHNNRIEIKVYVILKYGVSISAVAKNLKDSIKYNVEDFTGMIVDNVDVHIKDIRI